MKASFFLRDPRAKLSPVHCVLNHRQKRAKFSTQIKVPTEDWNSGKQWLKQRSGNDLVYKGRVESLYRIALAAEEVYAQYPHLVLSEIKNKVMIKAGLIPDPDKVVSSFKELIDTYSDRVLVTYSRKQGRNLSESYAKGFVTLANHIDDWEKASHTALNYEDIDIVYADKYAAYMANTNGLSHNAINKDLKLLKTIMGKAVHMGLTSSAKFKDIIITNSKVHKIALTDKELKGWEQLILTPTLNLVRDTFLISCYIGIRRSEFSHIDRDCLNLNRNTLKVWQYKTKKVIHVPLNPKALELLEKIDFNMYSSTEQKYNKNLKKIAQRVSGMDVMEVYEESKAGETKEISKPRWKMVSSHTARRTAATNMFKKTKDIKDVMLLLGDTEQVGWGYVVLPDQEKAELAADRLGYSDNRSKSA